MALRRISPGSPVLLSVQEQKLLVQSAEQDPELREALETVIGHPWDSLSFGQKVTALALEQEKGRGAATLAASLRGRRDLLNVAAEMRGEESKDDLIARQQDIITEQAQRLSVADQQIVELMTAAAELPKRASR